MAKDMLEMRNITKTFFGVRALSEVNLTVREGEILAIVGENGAGKSTLMNILSGTYAYGSYTGEILLDGEVCRFGKIRDSEKQGIVIIHQELALNPYMSIAENIFLGNECAHHGVVDWVKTSRDAEKYMDMVALQENPLTLVKDIGVGKQQLVEIAKALAKNVRLLILDEPTASLNDEDSMHLLNLLLELKKQKVTSIIISHKLNEVSYVADRITIIRDGQTIETLDKNEDDFSESRIIQGMVGREMSERFPKRHAKIGDVIFNADHYTVYHPTFHEKKMVDDVSIYVRQGEIIGMYGLMGAGRTEFAMGMFGKSYGSRITGTVKCHGKDTDVSTVAKAIQGRIALITEDRKGSGLNLIGNICSNITLAGLNQLARQGVIDKHKEQIVAKDYCGRLNVKCTNIEQKVESLSGGNQQKVVFAKWIFTNPEVLFLDEPTRGVDVGAKYEIYSIINQLVEEGAGAVFISSDLTEILGMCDRVYIMNEGRIVGEMPVSEATQTNIMECIVGARNREGTDDE